MRAPGFTLLAVSTLAVAIGANTAVFSVLDVVMLRPLPYPDADALVAIRLLDSSERESVGADLPIDALDVLRAEPELFGDVAGWIPWRPLVSGFGDPAVVPAAAITEGLLERVLDVQPRLGRSIAPEEHEPGGVRTVVLAHSFWQDRLAEDPTVLGRALILDDVPYTIVGVLPEGFRPPSTAPVALWTSARFTTPCASHCATVNAIGRLRSGVSLPVARDRATAVVHRLGEERPDVYRDAGVDVQRLHDDLFGDASRALRALVGAVVLVLLIAATNVATLQLVRSAGRDNELALRRALGAGRGAIVRQLLVESGVLALLSGALGLGCAAWGTAALVGLAPPTVPGLETLTMNARVLGFTAFVALGSGTLSGLLPALRLALGDIDPVPRRRPGRGRRRRPWIEGLVAGQVALAVVLVVGAGLLIRSLRELGATELGFDPDGVLAVSLELPSDRFAIGSQRVAPYEELLDRIASAPAVVSVGATSSLPMTGPEEHVEVRVELVELDEEPGRRLDRGLAASRSATPAYFYTVGQRLVDGRSFDDGDDGSAPLVAVVNEALAGTLFDHPRRSPIGRSVVIDGEGAPRRLTVVGVVDDTRHVGVREPPGPALYAPFAQHPTTAMAVMIRADGDPMALADEIRDALRSLDRSFAVVSVERLSDVVHGTIKADLFAARLLTIFACCALFLAAVGLYGVVSLRMTHRLRELGIRLAVGAGSKDVERLARRVGVRLAGPGIVLGVLASLMGMGLLETLLYEVSPSDVLTLVATAIVMGLVVLAASWGPARRASGVDPVSVLREE
jgi:predicted permease